MNRTRQKPPIQWALVAVFVFVSVVILVAGSLYVSRLKAAIIASKKDELNAFADLKAMQIVRWWHERLGDAIILKANTSFMNQIDDFLSKEDNNEEKEEISLLLNTYINTFDYKTAAIIDKNGLIRLSVPGHAPPPDKYRHSLIPRVTREKNVMLTDIHTVQNDSLPEIDLIIPLDADGKSDKFEGGVIIFTIDPGKILYPLINLWPTPSRSSESLLLRREGDSIIYLNQLRHTSQKPLSLKRSVETRNLLGALAVKGTEGIAEGVDYRNIPVIGAIKRIPGSGWFMVSKVDIAEINEQVRAQITPVVLLIIVVITGFGAVIGWTTWHQRMRFYRQKYEAEVQQIALRKHFDYILKYANDIVLLMDMNLNIVEVNDRALEIYQYSHDEIIGLNIRNLRLPQYDSQLEEKLSILKREGRATYEAIHRRKDGSTFPIEISARFFEIEGKKYYQSIGRDITERKRTELSLKLTEQTYRDLFDTVNDAIYIHKTDGVFIDVNTGAARMYGYSREEMIGKSPELIGAPGKNDLHQLKVILERVFETGKSEQFEFWGKRKNGEIFPKDVVANKGKYFGEDVIIATARDVTLRNTYEEQLRSARDKAEESDRLKTAFLHNISHEIRTPMNAIVGFTALLDEPEIDPQSRKHFIDIIYQSTNQLLGIISDIVDISNIETGQVKLNLDEVNLNVIIKNLFDQHKITADQQGILFFYELKLSDDKAKLYTDKTKLVQIISNLLNNAFKFTSQGTIRFGYRVLKNEIEFFVSDTGIGIPAEKLNKVFDRFYQVESDSSRRYSGTGLGLSICKAYVEILGGRIRVNSEPGKGSEFCFTHPF